MDNTELTSIAERICTPYGFTEVKAELEPFPALKITWMRSSDWIHLQVSDFLAEVPAEIIEDLLTTLMERIMGNMDAENSDRAKECLLSDEFTERNRPLAMERNGLIGPEGRKTDLEALAARYGEGLAVGWTSDTVIHNSKLLRFILVPVVLDGHDEAVAAVIAHEAAVWRFAEPFKPKGLDVEARCRIAVNEAGLDLGWDEAQTILKAASCEDDEEDDYEDDEEDDDDYEDDEEDDDDY